MKDVDALCEACKRDIWKVRCVTTFGNVYLCADCGSAYVDNRDSRRGNPAIAKRILNKVFGDEKVAN